VRLRVHLMGDKDMRAHESPSRPRNFLSLKWKSLIVLSLVLAMVNASLAYLVYRKTTGQFELDQSTRRQAQIRELNIVLSQGIESVSAFAAFIPLLSVRDANGDSGTGADRLAKVLAEHGAMLDVEWGIEGVHYLAGEASAARVISWPTGRPVPSVGSLLETTRRAEAPQGQLSCRARCMQTVALPLLRHGRTDGLLVVERSIADGLREFHLLSGAEIALLSAATGEADTGSRRIAPWGRRVSGVTHPDRVLPILHTLARTASLAQVLDKPQRIRYATEWYEVFSMPAPSTQPDLTLLVFNRVTGQVSAIREATSDSIVLGLGGLVLSELILLLLMRGPMQRIQDVVFALPLLADRSYSRLRDELPCRPAHRGARDEIDVMVSVIGQVSQQIEALDAAHSAAEQALRESEQSLQLAQSLAKVATWVGRPLEGHFSITQGARRIDCALEGLGTWDEFLALVHPDDRSRLCIAWRQAHVGSLMDIEFRLRVGTREIDVHAMAAFDAVGRGRILHGAGMMQDVTEMRAVQRVLSDTRDRLEDEVLARTAELVAARNEAERLAQTKSQFLANMSHEIRTPLNAVLGLSQVGMQQSEKRRIATTFEQILDAGEHLLNVVNDVLDMSKLEAGKLVIEARPFELRKAVAQCVEMLTQRVEAKSLSLRVNVVDDLPEQVVGDEFRLQQILINLLSNAIKFTERGSVSLDVYRESGRHCFRVRDTGIGISPEQIERLFTPFDQLGDAGSRRHEGTGLGLSISNTLAMLMGGEIRVRSEPGVGSEFVLRVPLKQKAARGIEPCNGLSAKPAERQRLVGVSVLVADDVYINRLILQQLLEVEGAQVTAVADGAAAVAAVLDGDARDFDIALMDVQMPETDGREATRSIREAGAKLPIIGVTAHVSREERAASVAAGMDDQLVKPIMQDILVQTILRHVARDRSAVLSECRLQGGGGCGPQNTV
jgi:signal transduction histidine kinase/ActR/RegA family two-component response regulator